MNTEYKKLIAYSAITLSCACATSISFYNAQHDHRLAHSVSSQPAYSQANALHTRGLEKYLEINQDDFFTKSEREKASQAYKFHDLADSILNREEYNLQTKQIFDYSQSSKTNLARMCLGALFTTFFGVCASNYYFRSRESYAKSKKPNHIRVDDL